VEKQQALLDHAVIQSPLVRGVGPLLLGGLRYDPSAPRHTLWKEFPDALLELPRFLFTWSEGDAWMTINTLVSADAVESHQVESLLAGLESLEVYPADALPAVVESWRQHPSQEEWGEWVREALSAIERGRLAKVVLARQTVLRGKGSFSADGALRYLSLAYPECSLFAFDRGRAVFIGATPEVLARVQGEALEVACLAGSAGRGRSMEEDRAIQRHLLESPKERLEHAVVVDAVAAALRDVCCELRWDDPPRTIGLEAMAHLLTLFRGRLPPGSHVLSLVKLLHPTPAVGGVPRDRALEMVRGLEGDRGWYAAPVGWVGPDGSGEFAVAIRSALLCGVEATLFAGSGIVRGSDPQEEFRETEMKFQPLLNALGRR
jgi:menaquinone-specific isochorismate synthase